MGIGQDSPIPAVTPGLCGLGQAVHLCTVDVGGVGRSTGARARGVAREAVPGSEAGGSLPAFGPRSSRVDPRAG